MISCESNSPEILERYENGNPKRIKNYSSQKDAGTYSIIHFFPSGDTLSIAECQDNFIWGKYWEFYESGNKKEESIFKKGRYIDTVFRYYDSDQSPLKEIIVFGRDTSLIGVSTGFYPNGDIRFEQNYKNTKLNGPRTEYYPSGILKSQSNYVLDQQSGEQIEFFDHYHDSIIDLINGKPYLIAVPTRVKAYRLLNHDRIRFERTYDTTGDIASTQGFLFNWISTDSTTSSNDQPAKFTWYSPLPPGSSIKIILENEELNLKDTLFREGRSLEVNWSFTPNRKGLYEVLVTGVLTEKEKEYKDSIKLIIYAR